MRKSLKYILVLSIIAIVLLPFLIVASLTMLEGAQDKVQIIPIRGAISIFGEASSHTIVQQIASADADSSVKAIILEINSPGGTVVASEEIANAVAATSKPTVAWIREMGASGGYWIAASADKIVADPASITGSIGVAGSYLQFEDFFDEWGITYERLVTGEFKDTTSPYKEMTNRERELMLAKLYTIKSLFVDHVAYSRNVSREQVEKLATGEIFLGVEAQRNGLVDYLGGKSKAFEVSKELSNAPNAILREPTEGVGIFELFMSKQSYWFGKGFADSVFELANSKKGFTA